MTCTDIHCGADESTPVKAPGSASRKRNSAAIKPEGEPPAKKMSPVRPATSKGDSAEYMQESVKIQIDMGALSSIKEEDNKSATEASPSSSRDEEGCGSTPGTPIKSADKKDKEGADPDGEDTVPDAGAEEEEGTPRRRGSVDEGTRGDAGSSDEDEARAGGTDEATPRNKRAAAVMAKTKLNTRKHLNEKELEKDLLSAGIVPNEITVAEAVGGESVDGRTKSAKKAAARGRGQKKDLVEIVTPEEEKFACCDICEKWRKLPQHVDTTALPEQWNCSMNVWDDKRNTCEAPEEQFAEPSKEVPVGAVCVDEGGGKNRNSHRKGGSKKRRQEGPGEDGDDQAVDVDSKRKSAKLRLSHEGKSPRSEPGTPMVPEQWVQCDKCSKWRKVATGIDPEDLPKVWYCTMNTWNPLVARCGARQEKSQEKGAGGGVGGEDFVPPTGRGKYVRKQGIDRPESVTPVAAAAVPGLPVKKVTQWVQCERKNCQKWRKVGALIDMESLPEKW